MILATPTIGTSQDDPATDPNPTADLSEEKIASQIDAIQSASGLSDEEKKQLVGLYSQAQQFLKDLVDEQQATDRFTKAATDVDSIEQQLRNRLADVDAPAAEIPESATVQELKQWVVEAETEEKKLETQRDQWENETTRRQNRIADIPDELQTARTQLERAEKQLAEPPATNEKNASIEARQTLLRAQQLYLQQKLLSLEAEQKSFEPTRSLIPLQQRVAAKELARQKTYNAALQTALKDKLQAEAEQQVSEAEETVRTTFAPLKPLSNEILQITKDSQTEVKKLEGLNQALTKIQDSIRAETEDFDRLKNRIDTIGLTNALGRLLRDKRSTLTREKIQATQLRRAAGSVREIQESTLAVRERQAELIEKEAKTRAKLIEAVRTSNSNATDKSIENEVDRLLEMRLDRLATLQTTHQSIFDRSVAVDSARLELIQLIDSNLEYLDERVLWVPSDRVLSLGDRHGVAADLRTFIAADRWTDILAALKASFTTNIIFFVVIGIIISTILLTRKRAKKKLVEIGQKAKKRSCRDFTITIQATLITAYLALQWPAVLFAFGYRIRIVFDTELFSNAIGIATINTALFLIPFEWVRQTTRPGGLMECHLGTHPPICELLRKSFRWLSILTPAFVWLVVLNTALQDRSTGTLVWSGAAGRVACIAVLIFLSVESWALLNPRSGLPRLVGDKNPNSWIFRLKVIWLPLALAIWLSLILFNIVGYYYACRELGRCLTYSFALIVGVISVSSLIKRWLLVRRRSLAMKQYLERMEKRKEQTDSSAMTTEALPFDLPEEETVDLIALNEQTLKLFYGLTALAAVIGLWAIWSGVMPAITQFGRFELWSVAVDGEVVDITVNHLLLCLFSFVATYYAYKNVPALMELILLQRLPFDSGVRFAITTITRYAIVVLGVLIALSFVRVNLGQYSWLIAGAGVGLGFGLQEIFANFISGLVVLVERPCRVGDVVTVDGVTGVVSKINIRATTVTNWDRQELIVPNKEFVTGRLLNWTLSNAVNRVVIPVGIAYGSDTELATRLLHKIASDNEAILDDPSPVVTFEAFGASTLDFVLRCYLPSLDNRLSTIHELHSTIDQVFRENNLEIAFPQQDLHLRDLPEDLTRLLSRSFLDPAPVSAVDFPDSNGKDSTTGK